MLLVEVKADKSCRACAVVNIQLLKKSKPCGSLSWLIQPSERLSVSRLAFPLAVGQGSYMTTHTSSGVRELQ